VGAGRDPGPADEAGGDDVLEGVGRDVVLEEVGEAGEADLGEGRFRLGGTRSSMLLYNTGMASAKTFFG